MTHPTDDELAKRLIDSTAWFHCDCEIKMKCAARIEELSAALEEEQRISNLRGNMVEFKLIPDLADAEAKLKEAVDVIWAIDNEYDPSENGLNARTMYEIARAFLASLEGDKP